MLLVNRQLELKAVDLPLSRFVRRKFCLPSGRGLVGVRPRRSHRACFQARLDALITVPPVRVISPGSFFLDVRPPQSSFTRFPLATSRSEHTCPGSRPSSRHHASKSTCRGDLPSLRYGPSSGFLSLSTVYAFDPLAGLFHPAATFRVHAVQGLAPSVQPYLLIAGRGPHVVSRS